MAILKRYNNDKWEPISSTDSSEIYVTNSTLSGEDTPVPLESVLERNRDEIDTLLRNVSWLAKHGGSGSGSGGPGGTGVSNMKLYFGTNLDSGPMNPDGETAPSIFLSKDLNYIISTFSYSGTNNAGFRLTISMLGRVIDTVENIVKRPFVHTLSLDSGSIITRYINSTASSNITVTYSFEDLSSGEIKPFLCTLLKSNVILDSSHKSNIFNISIDDFRENSDSVPLTVGVQTSITGQYRLYFSTQSLDIDVNGNVIEGGNTIILNDENHYIANDLLYLTGGQSRKEIGIDIKEDMKIPNVSSEGTTLYYNLLLVNVDNPQIRSSVLRMTILIKASDQVTIIPLLPSTSLTQQDLYRPLFIVSYGNSLERALVNWYKVYIGDTEVYYNDVISLVNLICVPTINLAGFNLSAGTYTVTITAMCSGGSLASSVEVSGVASLKITEIVDVLLPIAENMPSNGKHTIFDFPLYENASKVLYTTTNYQHLTNAASFGQFSTNISTYNIGIDSGARGYYYRFFHNAYGKITKPKNSSNTTTEWFGGLIGQNNPYFSFQIAYSIGKTSKDDLTIFLFGNIDYNKISGIDQGIGIVIKPHHVYVNIYNLKVDAILNDNTLNQIDIVYRRSTVIAGGTDILELYINGILTREVRQANNSGGISSFINDANVKHEMCIAHSLVDGSSTPSNFIDVDLYCLRFLSDTFNLGQIVASYINNYISYNRNFTENNIINVNLLQQKIRNNKILVENGKLSSVLYDFNNGEFVTNLLFSDINEFTITDALSNFPLPIVLIKIPNSNLIWKYETVRNKNSENEAKENPAQECLFKYYKAYASSPSDCIKHDNLTLKIQGTSSLFYSAKNFDITFSNTGVLNLKILFSPKEDWFPENTFTLKADVVDSGHINNAVIGKFVNNCFKNTSLMNTSCIPSYPETSLPIKSTSNPNGMYVKPTIEGFPCLLAISFPGENANDRDIRLMGIYSFNLGRESFFNLGYLFLKGLRPIGENTDRLLPSAYTFPGLYRANTSGDNADIYNNLVGYGFEGQYPHNSKVVDVDVNEQNYFTLASFDDLTIGYDYALISYNGDRFSVARISDSDIETTISTNNGIETEIKELVIKTKEGEKRVPYDHRYITRLKYEPDGYFWSNDPSYSSTKDDREASLWEMYSPIDNSLLKNKAKEYFRLLNNEISEMYPYTKGNKVVGNTTIPKYRITSLDTSGLSSVIHTEKIGQGEELDRTITIQPPLAGYTMLLSVKNTAFYYAVCMLFGLVDSFGKNMLLKHWHDTDRVNDSSYTGSLWFPGFYDMDTALGLTNTGQETIIPEALDYYIYNNNNNTVLLLVSPSTTTDFYQTALNFEVCTNKLFGIEDTLFYSLFTTDYNTNHHHFFSLMWSDIRSTVVLDSELFFNEYFLNHMSEVGEFIFNLDYEEKYVTSLEDDKLHGTRLNTIKDWIKKRIVFLDSVFGYLITRDTNSNVSYLNVANNTELSRYDIPWRNEIKLSHNAENPNISVISSASAIFKSSITSSGNNIYTYVEDGIETEIPIVAGGSTNSSGGIVTQINNSDIITEIINLNNIGLVKIEPTIGYPVLENGGLTAKYNNLLITLYYLYGSLASITDFNLSGSRTRYSGDLRFDTIFTLFKTWDKTGYGLNPDSIGLKSLNLSNLISDGTLDLSSLFSQDDPNIPDVYKNPFSNLIDINISNSNLTNVVIPSSVSLKTLELLNSSIPSITLDLLPLLETLDFNGCSVLGTVNISNCSSLTNLSFNSTNKGLQLIAISGCNKLKTFTLDFGSTTNTYIPYISIQLCSSLESIIIRRVKLPSGQIPNEIIIQDCPKLKTLEITDSCYTTVKWDKLYNTSSNFSIDFSNSSIKSLYSGTYPGTDIVDLTGINNFSKVKFTGNQSVEYIRFNNNSTPVNIPTSSAFSGCIELLRVYGHIKIFGSSAFSDSSKFSILGTNTTQYNGLTMIEDGVVKHFIEVEGTTVGSQLVLLTGDNVTNLILNNGSSTFSGTGCTILDIYYALYNISDTVTSLNTTFGSCNLAYNSSSNPYGWRFINSPSRYMFINCGNIISCTSLFAGAKSNLSNLILYSPTIVNGIYQNDGLFSPLTSCLTLSNMFYNSSNANFIVDRHLFRKNGNDSFAFKSLDLTLACARYIVYDSSAYSTIGDVTSLFSTSGNAIKNNIERLDGYEIGNLEGFFTNLKNLQLARGMFTNAETINFNKAIYIPQRENNGVLEGINDICLMFNCNYAYGKLEFSKLFENPGAIGAIRSSFRTKYNTLNPYIEFSENSLNVFNNSRGFEGFSYTSRHLSSSLWYVREDDAIRYDNSLPAFFNIYKVFGLSSENGFPYTIFNPIRNTVKYLSGFFNNGIVKNFDSVLEFPSTLFTGCTNLIDISYIMYDFNNSYRLTSGGFADCHNLQNVSYAFGTTVNDIGLSSSSISGSINISVFPRINCLKGSIPNKLFYHGKTSQSITYNGVVENDVKTRVEVDLINNGIALKEISSSTSENITTTITETYEGFIADDQTHIYCVPTTKVTTITSAYNSNTHRTTTTQSSLLFGLPNGVNYSTTTVTYDIPNANINNISYCFQGASVDVYEHSTYQDSDKEKTPDYQPYDYIYENETWKKVTLLLKEETYMWVYDGNITKYRNLISNYSNYEYLDDATTPYDEDSVEKDYLKFIIQSNQTTSSKSFESNSGIFSYNFCASPDLLRYCINYPTLRGLFYLCGSYRTVGGNNNNAVYAGVQSFNSKMSSFNTTYGSTITRNQLANWHEYGLKGRIVPYLLKPTKNADDLLNMFVGCKLLSWYTEDSLRYIIPNSFLTYLTKNVIKLEGTFAFTYMPLNISLHAFALAASNRKITYKIDNIFRCCTYSPTTSSDTKVTISGVFNNNNITIDTCNHAFSVSDFNDPNSHSYSSGVTVFVPALGFVNFNNNFKSGLASRQNTYCIYKGYVANSVSISDNVYNGNGNLTSFNGNSY